jgi:hypothetical protein
MHRAHGGCAVAAATGGSSAWQVVLIAPLTFRLSHHSPTIPSFSLSQRFNFTVAPVSTAGERNVLYRCSHL